MKRPRVGQLVELRWADIEHASDGWQPFRTHRRRRPGTYRTVGWVLSASRSFVVLAATINPSDDLAFCSYRIPWGAVRRWRRLP